MWMVARAVATPLVLVQVLVLGGATQAYVHVKMWAMEATHSLLAMRVTGTLRVLSCA